MALNKDSFDDYGVNAWSDNKANSDKAEQVDREFAEVLTAAMEALGADGILRVMAKIARANAQDCKESGFPTYLATYQETIAAVLDEAANKISDAGYANVA